MRNILVFAILILLAILAAGIFGALHNQLSYSIGASYFHEFKFAQFQIPDAYQNRIGASLVGVQASWWMGLIAGGPAFFLGLLAIRNPTRYFNAGIMAMIAVLVVTLVFSMGGLVLGMIAPEYADQLPLPEGISQPDSFLRAALMHEASYYGGFLGLFAALWSMWQARKADARH